MKILVSGCCGFIGFHLCKKLLELDHELIGIDNFNNYYDVQIKYDRYAQLKNKVDILNANIQDTKVYSILPKVDLIIHLAAQAGVRYSLVDPESYVDTNIVGTFRLLDFAKQCGCEKFMYASSASVYGSNPIPWNEEMLLKPISLYGATKVSTEVLADSYYTMFGIKSVGLRFFSVYGPWGRPDLSLWKWTEAILKGENILLYNNGKSKRSWSYIDDIIAGVINTLNVDNNCEKFNLGNENMIPIDETVYHISNYLNKQPEYIDYQPLIDGDIAEACPDLTKSKKILNFNPKIEFEEGIKKFIDWFREYKNL